jgi:multidrug efflux pump subunit AcrB
MWIVRLALKRPYTFVVMALLILILSPLVILRTPVDIFPEINIPVVSVGAPGHVGPDRVYHRARPDDHGQ